MRLPPVQSVAEPGFAQTLIDGLGKIKVSEINIGSAIATWPGGQTFSTALQVAHGLSQQAARFGIFAQPVGIPGLSNGPPTSAVMAGATTAQFQIQWFTIDGVNPAGGSTIQFYWLAFN